MGTKQKVVLIPFVDAGDLSKEAEDWLVDHEYATHCDNSVVQLCNKYGHDNDFVRWFEDRFDHKLDHSKINYIAVEGT